MRGLLALTVLSATLAMASCGGNSSQLDSAKADQERAEAAEHFKDMKYAQPQALGAEQKKSEKTTPEAGDKQQ